jgi:hypothetical protein
MADATGGGVTTGNTASGTLTVNGNLRRVISGTPTTIGEIEDIGTLAAVSSSHIATLAWNVLDAPLTTSPVSYTIYCQGVGAAGAVGTGHVTLWEIMGALDLDKMLPANDDAAPPRLVG